MRRCASAALVAVLAGAVAAAGAPAAAVPPAPSGAALAGLGRAVTHAPIATERIYFVLPDRYANGDPGNDRGGLTGLRGVTGFDPADPGWFHGGDYRGLTDDCANPTRGLARIRALGFTAVWVTPPVQQKAVQGSSAAYHGYWGLDFTTVDPHLGTEAEFGAFVACAHRLGLKVYLDVVVNHTADVILPTGGTTWIGPEDRPYRDCRGRVFQPARYAAGGPFPCLRAASMPRPPLVFPAERSAKKPAWLNDVRRYHNRGEVDFSSCSELCLEQGDFFGLDDLFTEQAVVVDGLARLHGDWIRRYRVDGFRVDTARHVNRSFFRTWLPRVRAAAKAAGVPGFEIFGEVFVSDAIELSGFVRERKLPNVLDFPFQDAATRYAAGEAGARGMVARLDDDDYFRGPDGVAPTPPTFLGNHDMGRVGRLVRDRSGGVGGAVLLRRVQLAHSLMYLLRGAPVVYYGDEVGIIGRGGDKEARQDLFSTQVSAWQSEERVGSPPIGTGSSFDVAGHPVAEHLKTLAALRDAHPALSTGASVVRVGSGAVLAVSRIDAAARREYVAAFNAGNAVARVAVPTGTPSSAWTGLLGGGSSSDAAGRLTLSIPPQGALLLRAEAPLPARAPAAPTVRAAADDLTELVRLTAAAGGSKTVSVAFALKRATGAWRRLAVDDSPPYRAFLDPAAYRRGERVHVLAVARGLDGTLAVSRVIPLTIPR